VPWQAARPGRRPAGHGGTCMHACMSGHERDVQVTPGGGCMPASLLGDCPVSLPKTLPSVKPYTKSRRCMRRTPRRRWQPPPARRPALLPRPPRSPCAPRRCAPRRAQAPAPPPAWCSARATRRPRAPRLMAGKSAAAEAARASEHVLCLCHADGRWPGVRRGASAPGLPVAGSLVCQACADHLTVLLCISLLWTADHCKQAGTHRVRMHAYVRAWAFMGGCTAHLSMSG